MSLHEGHRARLKDRYLFNGPGGLYEHEALELILTFAIPRRDVNPLAHMLINKYGSLRAVLMEDPASLANNAGVSMHTAILLNLFGNAPLLTAMGDNSAKNRRVYSIGDAVDVCRRLLDNAPCESTCQVLLDARSRIVYSFVTNGDKYSVSFDMKKLISHAVACCARSVIIGHRHMSARAVCSDADLRLTARVTDALKELDISLSEHIIVADQNCCAMLHGFYLDNEPDESGQSQAEREKNANTKLIG